MTNKYVTYITVNMYVYVLRHVLYIYGFKITKKMRLKKCSQMSIFFYILSNITRSGKMLPIGVKHIMVSRLKIRISDYAWLPHFL